MEYINLGKSGLKVSRICLGCMSYGVPERGAHPWSLDEEKSRPFIKRAVEFGINFFDTANVYSDGTSEEITGRALRDFARRDEVVIATKVFHAMRKDPNGKGLSRKAIMSEIDASLKRLGTDYIDLYQIHRWDYETPIEETLEALHDVVKIGKARYIGASSLCARGNSAKLPLHSRSSWMDAGSSPCKTIKQSALSRGRERNDGPLRRRGDRCDPLEPPGTRTADTALGSA